MRHDDGPRATAPGANSSRASAAQQRLAEALLHVAEDALFVWQPGGGIESWNQGATALYGYAPEEALGRNPHELLGSHPARPWSELEAEVLAHGSWDGEIEQTASDGRHLTVWARLRWFVGDDGVSRVLESNRDFTARRELERELARQRDRARELLDIAGAMIVAVGADERVILANRRACQVLGCAEDEIVGQGWFDVALPARSREQHRAEFRDLIAGRVAPWERHETPICTRHGQERIISWHNTVLRDESNRIVATLSSGEDVTEQRRDEAALRAADHRKDEFLAILSHELRKPLAPIRTALEILARSTPAGATVSRAQGILDRQVALLARLVDDLLDVSRITQGTIRLQRQRVELGAFAHTALADRLPQLEAAGVTASLHAVPDGCWVDADPARLAQILDNLLDNAAKFTPAGGRVDVSVRADGDVVVVEVRDTGVGLAPEVLDDLFQPFRQAPQTLDRADGGLGLGLALVKGLVELHGGTVAVTSAGLGLGTTFAVRLPLAGPPPAEPGERPAPGGPRRRVLVIEDHVDTAESLRLLLELSGHEVQIARDGAAGLAAMAEFHPHVVLCDLGLPVLSGYEVARAVRAEPRFRDIVLVAISGYALPEDRRRSAGAGFDLHLAKPASHEALAAAIRHERGTGRPAG